ncbi:DUF2809 domain-containing protein [Cohnella lupini]|nr:DUF2809 domain-containing protein [Cohnella lupini]
MRERLYYGCAIVVVVILGISSREFAAELPVFVAEHFGDGLWASMVYLGFRMLDVRRSRMWALGLSAAFCCGVEVSQLYQAEWINEIRSTTLGALILGQGFLAVDFVRYGLGIAVTFLVDWFMRVGRD